MTGFVNFHSVQRVNQSSAWQRNVFKAGAFQSQTVGALHFKLPENMVALHVANRLTTISVMI